MPKKNSQYPKIPNFFTPPGPHDPVGNVLATVANMVTGLGIQKLQQITTSRLGLNRTSTEDEIRVNRSRLQLEKQVAENNRIQMLTVRQQQYYDLKIEEKRLQIEKRQYTLDDARAQKSQLAIPMMTEVVSGALEVTATSDGLCGSSDQPEGYAEWLESFTEGKVLTILGKRGSGKTAQAAKIGEYMMAVYGMPVYWVGLPEQARGLLPSWIKLVDSPDKCPVGCFIIIDESGLQYMSLSFNTDRNKFIRALLQICRQRHCSLVFVVQSTRDLESSIVRQSDSILFKEPGLNQPDSERPEMRARARKAAAAFKDIPRSERCEFTYVFDDNFEGFIQSTPPSFWSENLSTVYAHLDLMTLRNQVDRGTELQRVVIDETKLLETDSLDHRILQLKRGGHGIERIAKDLGCTTYRVRKCLDAIGE